MLDCQQAIIKVRMGRRQALIDVHVTSYRGTLSTSAAWNAIKISEPNMVVSGRRKFEDLEQWEQNTMIDVEQN